jgi:hypothetical protein
MKQNPEAALPGSFLALHNAPQGERDILAMALHFPFLESIQTPSRQLLQILQPEADSSRTSTSLKPRSHSTPLVTMLKTLQMARQQE